MTLLTLASTSPARKKILSEAGLDFAILHPGVDEDALVDQHNPSTACDLTLLLAEAKARAGAAMATTDLVLGCDSALELDGEILGKPLEPAVAIERWKAMRGRTGVLHSGHHLIDRASGSGLATCTQTTVHFSDISDGQIEAYVATEEPLQVAGAFTIDSIGGAYIDRIEGDYHTVVGLSLRALRELTESLGRNYESLWR
ncbi:MAG: Maf family protein [Aquiluna sp.]